MNCYDCANGSTYRNAVAVCTDCGAGVCIEHAVNVRHWLTRTQALMRVERVEPAARRIHCETCHAAHTARRDVTPDDANTGSNSPQPETGEHSDRAARRGHVLRAR